MKKKLMIMTPMLVALALAGTACATLFESEVRPVSVLSEPEGAEVLVDGVRMGMTPVVIELLNQRSHVITLRKDGYKDVTCRLYATVAAHWVILDILGGLIPVIVDAATGKWKTLDSDHCGVILPEIGGDNYFGGAN